MHSLVKGIILSVWIWFIIKVSEKFRAIQSIKFKTNFYIILYGYGIHMEK